MTSVACCSGSTHPGTPQGHIENLHGLPSYVADPPNGVAPKGVIVMIPDAFGWEFVNLRLLCDTFAERIGAQLLLPDFMNGKSADLSALLGMKKMTDSNAPWLSRIISGIKALSILLPFMITNRRSVSYPRITKYLTSLRESTDLPIGVIGYCWGGQHATLLAHGIDTTSTGQPLIDAAFTAHPSNVTVPSEIDNVKLPLAVCNGSEDFVLSMDGVKQIEEIFSTKEAEAFDAKQGKKFEVKVVEGARHGFAVRGDPDDKAELGYAQVAEDYAVAWFGRWLVGNG